MEHYICIHGHFYQPPRENPWLETVELQDSATPYHDWNERIAAECYAPNATARIMDGQGRIAEIVNNYSKISFNFGPTLLAWVKEKMPEIYDAIIRADQQSKIHFSGHGSAMAQVYNHMILPLGNERDKQTQVIWGICDFESRFGRQPEGMWLAETAADTATLEALAAHGIRFTVLSPFQAARTRKLHAGGHWKDVNGARIDPSRAYLMRLPSGRQINLFFYDAPVSRAVAFEHLLTAGEKLVDRLLSAFSDKRPWDQLVHIATDGESYGHHHRHGEMALAYALRQIESSNAARLTNYGEFLEKHPPTHEVQIHEGSAWSCPHGVDRWRSDCGCNTGGHGGWNQKWREPLRNALDWLRDELAPRFENKAREVLHDPWRARDNYIRVILDRARATRDAFFKEHATHELRDDEQVLVLQLMELQRHTMLMYTSCGWFFDELSGIETVQVIQYAARAIQLAREIFGEDLEPGFLERLQHARSNIPENSDGRFVYERFVKPAMIDWEQVVAHYAVSSLFENYGDQTKIFLYSFEEEARHFATAGKAKLAVGRTKVQFDLTKKSDTLCYAVLYMGEHNLTGGVRRYGTAEEFEAAAAAIRDGFERGDFPETIRRIDRHFGPSGYSLKSLFKDERRRILNQILASTREDLENRFRLITERYTPLMRFLTDVGAPLPAALQTTADYVLHVDLRRLFENGPVDVPRLRALLAQAHGQTDILDADFSFVVARKLEQLMEQLAKNPEDLPALINLKEISQEIVPVPIGLNLWKVQNTYFSMLQTVMPENRKRAAAGDEQARQWIEHFLGLGHCLQFAVDHIQHDTEHEHPGTHREAA